ncbi:TIGR01621 family pseudouridine synthase [Halioxenophilus sp. WMMB6]|uniref:TIGR01621 family pseudouridine synthase n=1 Tax=Halioxenophilus sp. WMMB6 TaxID=3073815 RepID=UPI00295F412F|nr:TIGR01621 family pseudouridine synthase [Halioxenophilus sp. WMMB6]
MDYIVGHHEKFLVAHKPPNWDFHDCDGQTGFFNFIKQSTTDGTLWPVHRLDKVTSGLLLMARSQAACTQLSELFATRQVVKIYLALAHGKPKKKQGVIVGDMVKSRRGAWRLTRETNNPAVTRFVSLSLAPSLRLYLLRPETGQTHQLRVAMRSLGTPILGDKLYGGEPADRVYLHAYQLSFELDGSAYRWQCMPSYGDLFKLDTVTDQMGDAIEQLLTASPLKSAPPKEMGE